MSTPTAILVVGPPDAGATALGQALSNRGFGPLIADGAASVEGIEAALAGHPSVVVVMTDPMEGATRVERVQQGRAVFHVRLRPGGPDTAGGVDRLLARGYDLDLHLYQYRPVPPSVDVLADHVQAAIEQSWFGGQPPTWAGFLVTRDGSERAVRLWEALHDEVAPAEAHGYLFVEGHPELDPPRSVPGGDAFQATHLTFARLHQVVREQDAFVSRQSMGREPDGQP